MDIGKMINSRRLELGLTLEAVGNAVGVSKSTVKKWEDGYISNMKRDKIALLAYILQLNPVSLVTGDLIPANTSADIDELYQYENIIPLPKTKKVPLLGTIACGEPILAAENIDKYVEIADNIRCDFALTCKGDSMINARILDGDIAFIRKQPDVENGEIAAVLIDNEATLKRVRKYQGKVVLMPENPAYEPFIYVNEEINTIKILGKAVAFLSTVN